MPRATPASKASHSHPEPTGDYPENLYIGTSGWAYPTWKPQFYPEGTPARAFLRYYASRLSSVEVNYTFRSLPTAKQLEGWLAVTPSTFRFALKAPQRITHFQRLRESNDTVAEFLASLAPVKTAGQLGPLLFQLPPNFAADNDRLESFLSLPAFTEDSHRIAFEFRHTSWFSEATYSILRRHNAALCIAESDDFATPEVATADFRCFRLRRDGGYSPSELTSLEKRFNALAGDTEVYAYFKHEDEPIGALNASSLLDALRKAGTR